MSKEVRGYKVFNRNWTCRDKQYTCPGEFEENCTPVVCVEGMHFCKRASDCFNYYRFNPESRVAEVIAYGEVAERGDKCCTNKLKIVREIPWAELLEIVNVGKACSGLCNSGNRNSGNYNSGDYNSGNYNSGNYNSGNRNSGDYNSGDYNSGDYNSGDCNSGDCNSGNYNSGNRNSGDCNSGNYNSGNRNSGNYNSGNYNSGNYNSGNRNSGDYNKCSFSNGCLNTVEPKIYMFNKPSEWTYRDWLNSEARYLLNQIPSDILEYVWFEDMTSEEKAAHPEAEVTGGYLKQIDIDASECAVIWWHELSDYKKRIIKTIPNFDKEIFKEITGIDVEAKDE